MHDYEYSSRSRQRPSILESLAAENDIPYRASRSSYGHTDDYDDVDSHEQSYSSSTDTEDSGKLFGGYSEEAKQRLIQLVGTAKLDVE